MQVFHDSLCWVWLVWDYNLTAAFEGELYWQYSRLLQTYTIIKSIKCGTFHYPSCLQFYQENSNCDILVWFGGVGSFRQDFNLSVWDFKKLQQLRKWDFSKNNMVSHSQLAPTQLSTWIIGSSMHSRKLGGNLRMRVKFCMMSTTEHIWLDELSTDKGLCQFPVKPSPQPEEKSCQLSVEPSLYPEEKNCQKTNIIETRDAKPSAQDHSPHSR